MPAATFCLVSTLIVASSGGGDFTSIQAAIDAAQNGDVLLVQAGTYGAFNLSKAVTILGPAAGPKPLVQGHSVVTGPAFFALGGLALERVTVEDVLGHGTIDDCRINSPAQWGLGLFRCDRIQVERCTIEADKTYYTQGHGAALYAECSGLTVVDCMLVGPDSAQGELEYTDGGEGLLALDSQVRVVSTSAQGGKGGTFLSLFTFCEPGGSAFRAEGGTLSLQGINHLAAGGVGGLGCIKGASIFATNGAQVAHQGCLIPDGVTQLGGAGLVTSSLIPSMRLAGSDLPGEDRRLLVSASHSQPVIILGSLGSAAVTVPGFEGAVGIDLSGIVYVGTTIGQKLTAPSTVPFKLPPSFIGLEGTQLHLQGVTPFTVGTYDPTASALTNPVTLLLRY